MNNKFLKLTYTMMAALLLTACSQDEATEQGTILPEGKYLLEIWKRNCWGESWD